MRFEKELEVAQRAARRAGEIALRYRSQGVTAEEKEDHSPVTIADRECEKAIVATIRDAFPDDGLLGEEGASRDATNGRKWIIDPIDGTRDFVRGNRLFANLIGLEVDGEVAVGVVNLPALDEMSTAVIGEGAWSDGQRLRISRITQRSQAVLCISALNAPEWKPYVPRLFDFASGFWAARSLGGCPDAMLVASGKAEVYFEPHVKAWDLAPVKLVVEEAGGRFLNFDGGSSIYGGNCVCCVPALERDVREFLGIG
jgi:histidinol phosphatase-like enzyme (inositol monophosphatase family)